MRNSRIALSGILALAGIQSAIRGPPRGGRNVVYDPQARVPM